MVQLGSGFAQALEKASQGAQGELARLFDTALKTMGEELYRRLREDLIAEVRSEIQRSDTSAQKIAAAIEKIGTPVVHVQAPPPAQITFAPHNEVLPADVTVNMPPSPPAQVVVERPKKQRLIRDAQGKITGSESV